MLFWWDVYIVFKKKRENRAFFISPDLQFYSIYIVNNAASPYVENSIKHFYFNRKVGILENKQKNIVCFPLSVFCVLDHRVEFYNKGRRSAPERST